MPPKMSYKVEIVEARMDRVEGGLAKMKHDLKVEMEVMKQTLLEETGRLLGKKTDEGNTRG